MGKIVVTMEFESVAEMCRTLGAQGAEAAVRSGALDDQIGEAALEAVGVEQNTRAAIPATVEAPAEYPAPVEEKVAADPEKEKREAVRAELDALGVQYSGRFGTDRLEKLLAEEKAKRAAPAPAAPMVETPAAPAPSAVDPADVLRIAKLLAETVRQKAAAEGMGDSESLQKGILAVETIVKPHAPKISMVPADKLGEVLAGLTAALAAANGKA